MKIAIFGASATGKTTIALELSKILQFELRNCGEFVKTKTKQLGLSSPDQLSISNHQLIDYETRNIVQSIKSNIIIEGRYLNYVLNRIKSVNFFELTCSFEERSIRMLKRNSKKKLVILYTWIRKIKS